ncbi:hypothetical protein ALC56_02506 [Trachymyrmex septentrionalis]|uniref:DUF4218 domain-containing protein n=1 Tax=Trachymyrmex septentrionalis TaxID=34720 RepID=A0A151K083_9HYME|nr:hypothetical protein ALC56_02506 [Trachymyrmex septentrionalis]
MNVYYIVVQHFNTRDGKALRISSFNKFALFTRWFKKNSLYKFRKYFSLKQTNLQKHYYCLFYSRNFFHFSIPILEGILRQNYFNHYLLVITIFMLYSKRITFPMININRDFLNKFVYESENSYSSNIFLKEFIDEYNVLHNKEFYYEDLKFRVSIRYIIYDAPALSFVKCIKVDIFGYESINNRRGMISQFPLEYMHLICNSLHCAIRILCHDVDCIENNQYAKDLLIYFVNISKILYRQDFIIYNVHNLIHLTDNVAKFGHLDIFSRFPFESFFK